MQWRKYSRRKLFGAALLFVLAGASGFTLARSPSAFNAVGVVLFAGAGFVKVWEALSDRYFARLFPETKWHIRLSESELAVSSPHGDCTIAWSQLDRIVVRTTATGPFTPDFFIHLIAGDRECMIPAGAHGSEELIERILALPGFDHEAFIAANGSTQSALFPCWTRPAV